VPQVHASLTHLYASDGAFGFPTRRLPSDVEPSFFVAILEAPRICEGCRCRANFHCIHFLLFEVRSFHLLQTRVTAENTSVHSVALHWRQTDVGAARVLGIAFEVRGRLDVCTVRTDAALASNGLEQDYLLRYTQYPGWNPS
jgi:hypothetical protein